MKTIAAAFAATALMLSAAAADEPDLIGTWTAESGVMRTTSGEMLNLGKTSTIEFVVTEQDGPVFSGVYRWVHPETMQDMHDGSQVTHRAEEQFVGVVHFDGKTITFADHPDTTIYSGQLMEADRMELISVEAGPHAFVGRIRLVRQ